MPNIRVSQDFFDRLKEEHDVEETYEGTLRYLLNWTDEEEEEEEEEEDQEEEENEEEE